MDLSTTTLPKRLQHLVHAIEKNIDANAMSPKRIAELVAEADIQTEDLMPYADFDHPIEDCYGRKMVYDGGAFEVMVMSWQPGDFSSIHNHGYTQWGMVQVFGHAQHFIYSFKQSELQFAKREILAPKQIIKVNNALIHQMGNGTDTPYLTLHIYGCPNRDGDITADAKNFDLELDRISHTNGGAFFNLPEDQVCSVQDFNLYSKDVFFHYAHLLMDYYRRLPQSAKVAQMQQELLEKMREQL